VLSAPALADDVRDLHAAMEHLYAGYPELLQNPRFDVDQFFAAWEDGVRKAGATITFGEGVLKPFVELRKVQQDNHLAMFSWGVRLTRRPELVISEYQAEGHVAGLDAERCSFGGLVPMPGTVSVAREMSKERTVEISTFSARSTADALDVRCGDTTTRFERRPPPRDEDTGALPPYEWHTVGDATVISVRRLYGSPKDEATLAQLVKDYDLHRKKPVIVFDFRGNGGGNDGYVYRWIARAVRGPWPSAYLSLHDVQGASPCGDWNALVEHQIEYERVDDADAKRERDDYWKKTVPSPQDPVQILVGSKPEMGEAKAPYTGRVFVLVDRWAGSSGESAPDALRLALHATLIGERTAGFAEFGNIRPWIMPRTGIGWQLASKRNYYEAPRDGVGQPVAVYLDANRMDAPVDALVPLLERIPKEKR
jgi:hypothetical protein